MNPFAALVAAGSLAPIDAQLGGLLMRRALDGNATADDARLIGLAGALLSAERAHGHSCLDVDALAAASSGLAESLGHSATTADAWRAALDASPLCGDGSAVAPLVLDGERLYLGRYYVAEERLATAMRARIATVEGDAPGDDTIRLFRALFPAVAPGETDWQAVAAAAALRNRVTIVTGGPGTGKTTTVAKLLALLLSRQPTARVALAAPTGKAAARLAEAVAEQVATLPIADALRARIPTEGRTLHRLLGYQPWNDSFAASAAAPLSEDVVIVDEASMVDVLMMDALFAALRPAARVILLGDQDQLASVDTGFVLGDACHAAARAGTLHGAALGGWVEQVGGARIETGEAPPIRDVVVRLRRSYRFDAQPGIGALAVAIRDGDAEAALAVLADGAHADVSLRPRPPATSDLVAPFATLFDDYIAASDPAQALERFASFRVLCALREGPSGVAGLNERIERWLRARGIPTRAPWYEGRPVLITANDHSTRLYNGDVGVTVMDRGSARVCFPDARGGVRCFAPSRLPAHETAWAMTVHKSQGSEFAQVMLVLPPEDSPVLTRELLYTAVTRARAGVDIVGEAQVLARGIARATRRSSGLAEKLGGAQLGRSTRT